MRLLSASLLLLSACSVPADLALIDGALPADSAWIAVLSLDANGSVLSASGMIRRERVARALSDGSGSPASYLVLGYTAAELEAIAPGVGAERLFREALRIAADTEPVLPAPSYHAWFDAGGVKRADAPLPALTAAWLPACPNRLTALDDRALVDFNCANTACAASVRQTGCEVLIDLRGCGFGELRGSLDAAGEFIGSGGCREDAVRAPAVLSLRCEYPSGEICLADVYPSGGDLSADVARKTVIDVPPMAYPYYYRTVPGYLRGSAILSDRVAVLDYGGSHSAWFDCVENQRIRFFDLESLEEVSSFAAPSCTMAIAADPRLGVDRVVVAAGGAAHRLLSFDLSGSLVDSATITDPRISLDHRVSIVQTHAEPELLSFVYSTELTPFLTQRDPHVVIVPAADLRAQLVTDVLGEPGKTDVIQVSGEGPPGTLWVAGNSKNEPIRSIELSTGEVLFAEDFWTACTQGFRAGPSAILWNESSGRVLITGSTNETEQMFVVKPDFSECARATYFSNAADAVAVIAHPRDPSLAVVAVSPRGNERRGVLTLFDPAGARFLPESLDVGFGPPAHLALDHLGRIFFVLPWSAELVRVELK